MLEILYKDKALPYFEGQYSKIQHTLLL